MKGGGGRGVMYFQRTYKLSRGRERGCTGLLGGLQFVNEVFKSCVGRFGLVYELLERHGKITNRVCVPI